ESYELRGRCPKIKLQNIGRQASASRDLLALAGDKQVPARVFFRFETTVEVIVLRTKIQKNPAAGLLRCLRDHIHSVSVGGVVVELDGYIAPLYVCLNSKQLPVMSGALCLAADFCKVVL